MADLLSGGGSTISGELGGVHTTTDMASRVTLPFGFEYSRTTIILFILLFNILDLYLCFKYCFTTFK